MPKQNHYALVNSTYTVVRVIISTNPIEIEKALHGNLIVVKITRADYDKMNANQSIPWVLKMVKVTFGKERTIKGNIPKK